jgi:hypothetical protein
MHARCAILICLRRRRALTQAAMWSWSVRAQYSTSLKLTCLRLVLRWRRLACMQAFDGWCLVCIRSLCGTRLHSKRVWNDKQRVMSAWLRGVDSTRMASSKMWVLGAELVKRSEVMAHMLWVAEAGEILSKKLNKKTVKQSTGAGLKRFRRAVRKVMVMRRLLACACRCAPCPRAADVPARSSLVLLSDFVCTWVRCACDAPSLRAADSSASSFLRHGCLMLYTSQSL